MQNVEEQILSYPHLSVEKQREVEAYVEANPEWASLLRDVRAIESMVGNGAEKDSADALLTTYVVVQRLHPEEVSPDLEEAFGRLKQKMENRPALRERAEAVRRRLVEAEAAVDPVSQFEELTGHTLAPTSGDPETSSESTASARRSASDRDSTERGLSFVDRLFRLPLALRWTGAAVGVLLGAYGVLFAASEASQSTHAQLASVDVSNQVVDNYTSTATRSAVPSTDTPEVDQAYVDALTAIEEARTSTLGLFPRYDAEKLTQAEQHLTSVIDRAEAGSFLALEARFYLGKVYLAQERVDEARSHFKIVVEREGRMADEALDILETLQEEYPVGR